MITDIIRDAAKASGLTQKELAELAQTSQRAVSDFLRGGNLHCSSIDNLAVAFEAKIRLPKRYRPQKDRS